MTSDAYKSLHAIFARGLSDGLLAGAVLEAGSSTGEPVTLALGTIAGAPDAPPMHADAIFDMASVTKVVATTTACARCLDLGLLDFDAPASDYLPSIAQLPGPPITLRDLATHVSGIDNAKVLSLPPSEAWDALVTRPPRWPVRSRFEYACRNFILLGRIVEQVSGQRLDAFCGTQVFQPLGMKDTRFGPILHPGSRVVATCVAAGTISDEQARALQRPVGNAGLFSYAADLARFCRAVLNDLRGDARLLYGPRSRPWMSQPCSPKGLPARAFGWDMRSRAEVPHRPTSFSRAAIGHSGWTGQSLWIDPEHDRYVIVLTNRTAVPGHASTHARQMVLRGELADALLACLA